MITLQDVADQSGFSKTAVSHVLNGQGKKYRISDKTSSFIKGIARDLGYQKDDLAKAVSTGRANVIGVIVNPSSLEFSAPIMTAIQRKLFQLDYFTKPIAYEHGVTTADDLAGLCRRQRFSGVVSYSLPEYILMPLSDKLGREGVPFAVTSDMDGLDCLRVASNNFQGGRMAARHLLSLGHRKIGLVAGTLSASYAKARWEGFSDATREAGPRTRPEHMIVSDQRLEIKALLEALMRRPDRPTAFFCLSDMFAITTVMTLAQNAVSVPGDISVMGYANMLAANHAVPSLTTIDEQPEEIGHVIAEKMISMINGTAPAHGKTLLDARLVVRESTGPAKETGGRL